MRLRSSLNILNNNNNQHIKNERKIITTLAKAKEIAKAMIEKLDEITDDMVIDDGFDSVNSEQQFAFIHAKTTIEMVEKTLALIDIEGYDKCELDQAWRNAWDGCTTPHLPECKMNHAIKYAQWILFL